LRGQSAFKAVNQELRLRPSILPNIYKELLVLVEYKRADRGGRLAPKNSTLHATCRCSHGWLEISLLDWKVSSAAGAPDCGRGPMPGPAGGSPIADEVRVENSRRLYETSALGTRPALSGIAFAIQAAPRRSINDRIVADRSKSSTGNATQNGSGSKTSYRRDSWPPALRSASRLSRSGRRASPFRRPQHKRC
jgi:hypothetical protein